MNQEEPELRQTGPDIIHIKRKYSRVKSKWLCPIKVYSEMSFSDFRETPSQV